jgi:ABC-2 type transport system ATP-binding protein
MTSTGTGVVASGVRRSFGSVEAVRGIDLTAAPGEVTALVGPNGAGKTTLLLVLATLLVPDAGDVRVAGYDPVTEPDAVRARMGWSPDVFGLYDNLTAREYVQFFADAYRLGAARARARADELLALARLEEYADRPVHVLSRGQKQRLGLTRALVHDPEVLLLDEPASGLDPRSRVELRELLRSLAASGTAVIVSSHLLGDLEELADRVVFVDRGATVGEHRLDQLPENTVARPWRLRSLDTAALLTALKRNGYDHDEPTPAGVDVRLANDEAAAGLLAGLIRDGVPVVSCQPLGGALEAAYLELTQ